MHDFGQPHTFTQQPLHPHTHTHIAHSPPTTTESYKNIPLIHSQQPQSRTRTSHTHLTHSLPTTTESYKNISLIHPPPPKQQPQSRTRTSGAASVRLRVKNYCACSRSSPPPTYPWPYSRVLKRQCMIFRSRSSPASRRLSSLRMFLLHWSVSFFSWNLCIFIFLICEFYCPFPSPAPFWWKQTQ